MALAIIILCSAPLVLSTVAAGGDPIGVILFVLPPAALLGCLLNPSAMRWRRGLADPNFALLKQSFRKVDLPSKKGGR